MRVFTAGTGGHSGFLAMFAGADNKGPETGTTNPF